MPEAMLSPTKPMGSTNCRSEPKPRFWTHRKELAVDSKGRVAANAGRYDAWTCRSLQGHTDVGFMGERAVCDETGPSDFYTFDHGDASHS